MDVFEVFVKTSYCVASPFVDIYYLVYLAYDPIHNLAIQSIGELKNCSKHHTDFIAIETCLGEVFYHTGMKGIALFNEGLVSFHQRT